MNNTIPQLPLSPIATYRKEALLTLAPTSPTEDWKVLYFVHCLYSYKFFLGKASIFLICKMGTYLYLTPGIKGDPKRSLKGSN